MKHIIPVVLAAAVLAMPMGAFAGESSAPGGYHSMGMRGFQDLNLTSDQQQAMHQIMEQSRQQMDQLHQQGRERILAALSPAHRALLAQIVGSLATAPNPDESAAIHQLDAALSPGEAQNVLSLHSAMMQQTMSIMQATHEHMLSVLTDQQRAQLQSEGAGPGGPGGPAEGGPGMHGMGHQMGQLSAGKILIHLSEMGGPMMHMDHGQQ
jgi:Spy/CpxP family protein refolding chaperone